MNPIEQAAFGLILRSGNARSLAYAAFEAALAADDAAAEKQLHKAHEELSAAHKAQIDLIQQEAQGKPVSPNLLLIHAQDHLMTAMAEVNLIERLIRVLGAKHGGNVAAVSRDLP